MGLGSNIIWRSIPLLCLAAMLTNCKGVGGAKGENKGAVSDCFTQLYPGRIVQNRLAQVIFQNGACIGDYQALNKISYHDKVMVSGDGVGLASAAESVLAVGPDNSVSVQTAGGPKKIGTIDINTYVINTEPGVEFKLMIPDQGGGMRPWSLEGGSSDNQGAALAEDQAEQIIINVPY